MKLNKRQSAQHKSFVFLGQWINNDSFPRDEWSIYGQVLRTNNDVKGWHLSLNNRAKGKASLPFYLLVNFLKEEADLVNLQMRLVGEQKLQRIQRKKYRDLQAKLMGHWDDYAGGRKTSGQLLQACAHLYGRGH